MDFFLSVGILALFLNLSFTKSRISILERKIGRLEQQGVSPQTASAPQAIPQSISQASSAPVSSSTPQSIPQPTSQNIYTSPSTTSEEDGGRLLGKIGIFAVLLGVAYFIKYAFDNNWVGPLGRVCIGLSIGILAIILGESLRKRYQHYSDVLMGGGLGMLYLSIYSGFFFYHIYPAIFAYICIAGITALSVGISILHRTSLFASVGLLCGFLTPLLISVTTPTPIELLTYILILDLGVALIAYVYKWIELNRIAFVGTMLVVLIVFITRVTDSDMAITLYSYSFVYFVIFLISSIAHHLFRKENSDEADAVFVTLNGVAHGMIGYVLLQPLYPHFMGYFMLMLAAVYAVIGLISYDIHKEDKSLNRVLPGMVALFFTVAIPLHFDGAWISLFWFLEAIIFYIVDKTLDGENLYTYGAVVYMLGLFNVMMYNIAHPLTASTPLFVNMHFGMYLAVIITAYILAGILSQSTSMKENMKGLVSFYVIIANIYTLFAITSEIYRYYAHQPSYGYGKARTAERDMVTSVFWLLYATVIMAIGFVQKIRPLRIFSLVLFTLTAVNIFISVFVLGSLYAVVSSISLGVLALIGSFLYTKYGDQIRELM